MKRIVSISLFLLLFQVLFSQTNYGTRGSNRVYENPTPGQITIMACSPIPDGVKPTRQIYATMVDCGFNMFTSSGNLEYASQQFSLIEGLDLKYMISSPKLRTEEKKQFVNAFEGNPQLGGWLFIDEPRYKNLNELSQQYSALSIEVKGKLVYMNLIGGLGEAFTGNAKTYYDYLLYIQKLFSPPVWSYDLYPISQRNGKINVDYNNFYSNLEAISRISQETFRPFWSFCQSMAFKASWTDAPAPTLQYLKFEAYNALAYGAQGIVYWTYGLRKSNDSEKYSSALVDLKGRKSKAWNDAQKVNKEIKKFNQVFFQCSVKEIRHTGDKIYKDTKKLSGGFGPFNMVRSGSAGVVLSRIENNGEKYIVIINRDVMNNQKITLELSHNRKIVNLTSAKQQQYSGITDITLTLNKADWVIFKEI